MIDPGVGGESGSGENHLMRLDHLSFAACANGLNATTKRLSEQLGAQFVDGGLHPRFGTRNRILPLNGGVYLEVVEVLDHPASDKAPFGQAVRARSEQGGGWLVLQKNFTADWLANLLQKTERAMLVDIAEKAKNLQKTEATAVMVAACEELRA